MGMSNYVLDIMDKAQERAEEEAMTYICSSGHSEGVYKDDMPDWVQEHWPDFLTDKEKQLFGDDI